MMRRSHLLLIPLAGTLVLQGCYMPPKRPAPTSQSVKQPAEQGDSLRWARDIKVIKPRILQVTERGGNGQFARFWVVADRPVLTMVQGHPSAPAAPTYTKVTPQAHELAPQHQTQLAAASTSYMLYLPSGYGRYIGPSPRVQTSRVRAVAVGTDMVVQIEGDIHRVYFLGPADSHGVEVYALQPDGEAPPDPQAKLRFVNSYCELDAAGNMSGSMNFDPNTNAFIQQVFTETGGP